MGAPRKLEIKPSRKTNRSNQDTLQPLIPNTTAGITLDHSDNNASDFIVRNPSTGVIERFSLYDDESVERMMRELFPNSRQNLFIPTDYHDYDW